MAATLRLFQVAGIPSENNYCGGAVGAAPAGEVPGATGLGFGALGSSSSGAVSGTSV